MELYTPGYKVTEILDETGDSLRRINVNDAELSYKLTSLFMNAKGRTREDAKKEGRVPIVAKLLLMRLNHENIHYNPNKSSHNIPFFYCFPGNPSS